MVWAVSSTTKSPDSTAAVVRSGAQVGTDPGQQFLDAEGLGDVVVGAGVEGFDLGALVIAHGENEHGGGGMGADGAGDFDAGQTGHHEVSDDEVGRPLAEDLQSLFRIVCGADVIALCGECGAEYSRDLWFVVDNQNSAGHRISSFIGSLNHWDGQL